MDNLKRKTKTNNFIEILFPKSITDMQEKGGIPSPEVINEWQDITERRLYVEDINETIIDYLSYYIAKWNLDDDKNEIPIGQRKPIKVFINSNGGVLNETMHCIDIIDASKTPVFTICQSKAFSAGGLLLKAGHKRYCYKSSVYLLHAGSTGMGGSTTAVFDTLKFQEKYEQKVKKFVLNRTKITEKEYEEIYRKEWYLDAEDMLKYGIVDEIIDEIV